MTEILRPAQDPSDHRRRVTIADVAQQAGVSMSAVSKVLRSAPGVSDAMRAKVHAAIDNLDYRPHAGARAMRGRTYTIGIAMGELSAPFQAEVAEAIGAYLEPTPYHDIIAAVGINSDRPKSGVEVLLDRQVDGLIVVAPLMPTSWLERVADDLPVVLVGRHGGGRNLDTVTDDEFTGARLMVEHLVDLGHTSIVHTCMPPDQLERPHIPSHTARLDGYVEAMRQHGLKPQAVEGYYSERGGYEAATEALDAPNPPTAIFAGADVAALGVLRAAREGGLRVPDDLTVAGYDNISVAAMDGINLTTINQSSFTTGSTAARLMLERLAGRTEPVHHVEMPSLVIRGTSGPPIHSHPPRA